MKRTRISAIIILLFAFIFYIKDESAFGCAFLALVIFLIVSTVALSKISGKKMNVFVNMNEYARNEEKVLLNLKFRNDSIVPVYKVTCEVICENVLTGDISNANIKMSVGPKKTATKELLIDEKNCGCIDVIVRNVKVYDMFMLFPRKCQMEAAGQTYIMPQVKQVPLDENMLHAYNMESYQYSPYQKGNDPSETFGIREYVEGDSPKTIHWKLTGKTGTLVVRELGLPVENSILLMIDKRLSKDEILAPELRSASTELFLSISHRLIDKGIGHSIGWMDYKSGHFVLEHVENKQELWAMTGKLLRSPYKEDAVSTPTRYIENCGDKKYASYFYVTAGTNPDELRLEDCGAVKVYRTENFK